MSTEGSGGGYDGPSKRTELEMKTITEVSAVLVDIGFLDKNHEMVNGINGQIDEMVENRFGFSSVDEMVKTAENNGSLRQKEAKGKLEIITEAVIQAAVEYDDGPMYQEFRLGSDHVTKILPDSLKPFGKKVAEVFIPDENIDNILNVVEEARQEVRDDQDGTKITLIDEINNALSQIPQSKVSETPGERAVKRSVRTVLNSEVFALKRDLGDTSVASQATYEMTKKFDGFTEVTQGQRVSDEIVSFVEDSYRRSGEKMVNVADMLKEIVDRFGGKLDKAGDVIATAADAILRSSIKFEKSTIQVIESQKRLAGVIDKVAEIESVSGKELTSADLLTLIDKSRENLSKEEQIMEVVKGRLDESAGLSAAMFLDKFTASLDGLYEKMSTGMKDYWDRQVAGLKISLEEKMSNGGNDAEIESLKAKIGLLESRGRGRENGEITKFGINDVEQILLEIEESQQPSTDISLNSEKLRALYRIINGHADVVDSDAKKLEGTAKKRLIETIKSRLLINDWFLAASTSHSIEDMFKTVARIHQGDVDNTMDIKLLKCMLDKRERVVDLEMELPVAEAWNSRQKANIDYVTSSDSNGKATSGYLVDLWNANRVFITNSLLSKGVITSADKAEGYFLKIGGPLMSKNEKFGIDRDYYIGLRNDENILRKKIVEICMARELEKFIVIKGETDETKKRAKTVERVMRAVELAKRLSVITYQDSVANIAFADADDYAEIINFKFIRYQDTLESVKPNDDKTKQKEGPKSKPLGFADIIDRIDSLTPSYLQTLIKKDEATKKKSVYSTLLAEDLDFDKMGAKSSILFHLGSIVFKKVLPTQQMFLKPTSFKDLSAPQEIYKRYDQLNKTLTEAASKGWDLLNLERCDMTEKTPLENKQRFFRTLYVLSMFGMAMAPEARGLDWSQANIEFARRLFTDYNFYGNDGSRSIPFLKQGQWEWIMKDVATVQTWDGGKYKIPGFGFKRKLVSMQEENERIQRRYSGKR